VSPDLYVLDTSALFAFIEDEDGSERVEKLFLQQDCILPWIVILEAIYITQKERGEAEANYRYALLKQLPVRIIWDMDEPVLLTAARIKANYHVSLADAIIAAYTYQHKAILVHKDPEFDSLADQIDLEALPYK